MTLAPPLPRLRPMPKDEAQAVGRVLNVPGDQRRCDTQGGPVAGQPDLQDPDQDAVEYPTPVRPDPATNSGGEGQQPSDNQIAHAHIPGAILRDDLLGVLAASVDDLEAVRKASENRLRQLTRVGVDKDGKERGLGLDESSPDVARLALLCEDIKALEERAVKNLQKQVKTHPLWKTLGSQRSGVGEKQFARLLAAVGDPYWNDLHQRPRTVSELWAYCGFHVVHPADQDLNGNQTSLVGGVAPKRTRGAKVNWSGEARTRAWLISESCVKTGKYYREVYDKARAKYDGAVHTWSCAQCGAKGKPAAPGTPLRPGHVNARAMRAISKELLREMWVAARDLHTV